MRSFIQNIVGFSSASDLVKLGKGYTLNMYQETLDSTEHSVNRILRPFSGYSLVSEVNGTPRGLYRVSRGFDGRPKVYGVWGNNLYLLNGNSLVKIGEVHQGSTNVSFAETGGNGSAHPHLVIADGYGVFAVDTTIAPSSQIDDYRSIETPIRVNTENIPISPTHIAYAYGYLVVNDAGTDAMYYSYQYPFETLTSKGNVDYDIFMVGAKSKYPKYGFVEYSEWQPDNTLALVGNGSRIFTFGERSYQAFIYNSNSETPFTSPDTASQMIGIKTTATLACFGSRCVWLGSAEMGDNQVFSLTNDGQLDRISTPEIERTISKCNSSTSYAFIYQYGQHVFYVITFPTDKITLCYDFRENGWVNLGTLQNDGTMREFRYKNAAMDENGRMLLQGNDSLVRIDDEKWTEHDGNHIVRKRAGGIIQVNHNRFFIDEVDFITNNGDYKRLGDKQCKVTLRYSADGAVYNDVETAEIGSIGEYDEECTFYNLGTAKYLTLEISCSEDVPFALFGITMKLRECS